MDKQVLNVHDSIEVYPDEMPYQQEIEIDGESRIWGFQWNEVCRLFTVDIYLIDGTPVLRGEIMMPYQALWWRQDIEGLPTDTIVPIDRTYTEQELDPSTLGSSFKLEIFDQDGDYKTSGVVI